MAWQHPREYYRVTYPASLRPRLTVQAADFEVIDVCERGLRFALAGAQPPGVGFEVRGRFQPHGGTPVDICGEVVRVERDEVALKLDHRIPLPTIMAEQRFLLTRPRTKRA